MNNFGTPDRNDATSRDREHDPAVDRGTQNPKKPRRGGADGAGVWSRWARFRCSLAASRWAHGDTIRGSKR